MADEHKVQGWLFQMEIWGYAVTGGFSRLALTFEDRNYDTDLAWWDGTAADRARMTLNGEPVPEWWVLTGARGRQDFHDESRLLREWGHGCGD